MNTYLSFKKSSIFPFLFGQSAHYIKKPIAVLHITIFFFLLASTTQAQDHSCGFDEDYDVLANGDLEQFLIYQQNEAILQNAMHTNPLAIMNNVVYTIPVVFHVVHLGEPIGIGSNVDDQRILNALSDLNAKMASCDIQFCLATRDPDGMPTTGINRVSGADVINYSNFGIRTNFNDLYVKQLSRWPNIDYINIWIVHRIFNSNVNQVTLGNATFPGSNYAIDGIVLLDDIVGVDDGGTLTHEMGHFFNLFHTFQGASQTNCPPNSDCNQDGDKVCDTPPHKLIFGGCDENAINDCTGAAFGPIVHNFMSYFSGTCRNAFTSEQAMRKRAALMLLRNSLTISNGCAPPCTAVTVNFTPKPNLIALGNTLNFKSEIVLTSGTFIQSIKWTLNSQVVGTMINMSYTFAQKGNYTLCLEVITNKCTNKKCHSIYVGDPVCSPENSCNLLQNGDFSQYLCGFPIMCKGDEISNAFDNVRNFTCFWGEKKESPDIYIRNNETSLHMINSEVPVSTQSLGLVEGKTYCFKYNYLLGLSNNSGNVTINTGLAQNPQRLSFSGNKVIDSWSAPADHYNSTRASFKDFFLTNPPLHERYFTYTHTGTQQYLYVDAPSISKFFSFIIVSDIVVSDSEGCCRGSACDAVVNFSYNKINCTVGFNATVTGSQATTPSWDFGDGSRATGNSPSHTYLYPGTFNVCASIPCDPENDVIHCQQITILPADCSSKCKPISPINATLCAQNETDNTYLSNFSFNVPKGYKPCTTSGLFVSAPDVAVAINSVYIDTTDPNHDVVQVAAYVTPINGFDLQNNAAMGTITLCGPEGDRICVEFALSGNKCEVCAPTSFSSTADCIDTNPADTTYVYAGSIDLGNIIGLDCGGTASEAGLSGSISGTEGDYTYNYTITTTNANAFTASTILCFNILGDKVCYTITIHVPEPCVPGQCVDSEAWNPKVIECSGVSGGLASFDFSMTIPNAGELCPQGFIATMEGGIVTVDSFSFSGRSLYFDVDFSIPCDEVGTDTIELVIRVCDENGAFKCLIFPFILSCEQAAICGGGGGGNTVGNRQKKSQSIDIHPNPASQSIMIVLTLQDQTRSARILDMQGRYIQTLALTKQTNSLDVSHYDPGVYLLQVLDDQWGVISRRFLIVK